MQYIHIAWNMKLTCCLMHRCGWDQICDQLWLSKLLWRLHSPHWSHRPLQHNGYIICFLYSKQ